MRKCCVENCNMSSNWLEEGISFLSFPKKPEMRRKWIKVLKLDETDVKNTNFVCSKHFKLQDFKNPRSQKKQVWPNVVPSRNIYASDIQEEIEEIAQPFEYESTVSAPQLIKLEIDIEEEKGPSYLYSEPEGSSESDSSRSIKIIRQNVDVFTPPRKIRRTTEEDVTSSSPFKKKLELEGLRTTLKKRDKMLDTLRKQLKRRNNIIAELETIISHLQQKISDLQDKRKNI